MPDLLTDDQTRAMFHALRAHELHRVVAPGTAHVHRTARRRRITTAAGVALAVLALAGGGISYVQLLQHPVYDGPTPGAAPTAADDELNRLADQARAAVKSEELKYGNLPGGVASGSGPLNDVVQNIDSGESGRGVPHGRYTLSYTCQGTGTAKLTWTIGSHTRIATMICSQPTPPTPQTADGNLTIDNTGVMTVRIEPDGQALARAAYAYVITKS